MGAEGGQEPRAQVAVELDGIQLATTGDQRLGECTLAGADFDNVIGVGRCNRPCNRLDNGLIAEKVLAEAFAGGMGHEGGQIIYITLSEVVS